MTETAFVVIGVSLVTWLLARAVRPGARVDGGASVLEYGRAFKILGACSWALIVLLVVAAIDDPSQRRLAVFGLPIFVMIALYLCLEYFKVRVTFDSTGIRTVSPWRGPRSIPWEAVTRVSFSTWAQWYVIETTEFGSVRLSLHLSGTQALLGELERRGVEVPRRSA